jgi:hypothetical protein
MSVLDGMGVMPSWMLACLGDLERHIVWTLIEADERVEPPAPRAGGPA